jgi:hypothetical protein
MKLYDKLCNPAKFYFILSTVTFIFILLQNIGTPNRFSLGIYSCRHSNTGMLLICNAVYILFWTWLLNIICKINTSISWIIVLFPFLLLFIALGLVLFKGIHKDKQEGFGYGEASQMTI